MSKNLTTKLHNYFSGYHTQQISKIMRNFKPQSQQQILATLNKIKGRKQYTQSTPLTQSFVNKIEYFILKKQTSITPTTFHIYQVLKQFNFLTPRLKYGIFNNLTQQMQKINDQGLQLKNNQLQVLLWFIYKEYPFFRQNKFQEIGSDYTLKLFQIHQFMNKSNKIPIWEPYIRISTMLQALGHDVQTRKDISKKELQTLNYTYLPYLTYIFKTPEQRRKYRESESLTQPLLVNLCNKYIDKDKIIYDAYVHHVEVIDNEETGEQVEKFVDPLTWEGFTQLFQLYATSMSGISLDETLSYKMNDIFWRICQSKNVQMQSAIRLLQIFSKNQNLSDGHSMGMISRIKDGIDTADQAYFKFLPGNAFIVCLNSIKNMQRMPEYLKKQFYFRLSRSFSAAFMWQEGQKETILNFCQQNGIQLKQQTKKFLASQ